MLKLGAAALLVAMTAPAQESASNGEPIAPFSAHFSAEWKGIAVGTTDISLSAGAAPEQFVYSSTMRARGIFRLAYSDDLIQKSWLSLHEGHVRPDRYHAQQGASSMDVDFDWNEGRVRGRSETKPVDLALTEGTQDVMSIQIEVMLDLRSGQLPGTIPILDHDQIKDFNYTLEGPTRLRTELGELDTLVVASRRPGNNRILRMWFAPSLGYAPVQAERTRDGKLEFAMRIKRLSR